MRFASFALCLALLSLLAGPHGARAEGSAEYGASSSGLCGLVHTGSPVCGRGTTLAATVGYGATFLRGRHDRGIGNLGIALVPIDWLALSLELAGRVDAHPRDALGKSTTGTGNPILRARVGMPLGKTGLRLGGEVGLWIPGREAPSFRAAALSPEFKLLLAFQNTRFQALGLLGARIDQSFQSAPDLTRVRPGDRVTLGLSDSHALLFGVGFGFFATPRLTVFGELSADVLLGKQAPAFLESPLRFAAGARYFVLSALQVELALQTSLSQRPSIAASEPLVPIEPRIAVLAGVRATFGSPKPKPVVQPIPKEPDPPPPIQGPPPGGISGVLTDAQGAPLPDVTVHLLAKDGTLETITDAQGRYSFEQLQAGKAELRADAAGFKSALWEVEIKAAPEVLPTRAMEPGESTGTLRCLVRSFESAALGAAISVRDQRGKRIAGGDTDKSGRLEFALPPGQYRVMIEAAGYRSQRTQVQVAANEVAILNVDMRKIE